MPPRKGLPKQPNEPLRIAFEESGLTLSDLCWRLGWTQTSRPDKADTSRLARALGMKPYTRTRKGGKSYPAGTSGVISHDNAVKILDALGLDPIDVGL